MGKKKAKEAPPAITVANCVFNGNTNDADARLELAKAIHANAVAATKLAEQLSKQDAPLLSVGQ